MSLMRINRFCWVIVLLIAAICIIQPVLGVNGTVSIAYRGSGGSYIGDTIIFDGQNTVGNITFLRITGPDLPADGVPIYDLNGIPGTGNPVEVNPDGTWKFAWYSSTVKGIEKMQTARYSLIAADLNHPEFSSTTSVFMKKAEFYANLSPNPATFADYVTLTGSAERGITYLQIDITDLSGKILRSYSSPVSASGYFNYGFHVDMPPGQYYITMSNPSLKSPLVMILTVLPPRTPTPIMTTVGVSPGNPTSSLTAAILPSATTQNPPGISAGTGTLSITSTPAGSSVYLDSVMMGKTPVDLGNINYGSHLVEIKSPGYQTYSVQVTVKDGSPVTISPVLPKSPSPIPLSPVTVIIGLLISGVIALYGKGRKNQ